MRDRAMNSQNFGCSLRPPAERVYAFTAGVASESGCGLLLTDLYWLDHGISRKPGRQVQPIEYDAEDASDNTE